MLTTSKTQRRRVKAAIDMFRRKVPGECNVFDTTRGNVFCSPDSDYTLNLSRDGRAIVEFKGRPVFDSNEFMRVVK